MAFLFGVIFGVVATVTYNYFFPSNIDKASRELGEEIDKLRK